MVASATYTSRRSHGGLDQPHPKRLKYAKIQSNTSLVEALYPNRSTGGSASPHPLYRSLRLAPTALPVEALQRGFRPHLPTRSTSRSACLRIHIPQRSTSLSASPQPLYQSKRFSVVSASISPTAIPVSALPPNRFSSQSACLRLHLPTRSTSLRALLQLPHPLYQSKRLSVVSASSRSFCTFLRR